MNNKLQEHSDKCTHNGSRGIYSIEITIGVFVEGLGKKMNLFGLFLWGKKTQNKTTLNLQNVSNYKS